MSNKTLRGAAVGPKSLRAAFRGITCDSTQDDRLSIRLAIQPTTPQPCIRGGRAWFDFGGKIAQRYVVPLRNAGNALGFRLHIPA